MKRNILLMLFAGAFSMALLSGCSSFPMGGGSTGDEKAQHKSDSSSKKAAKKSAAKSTKSAHIPRGSKFSKIAVGMSQKQVMDLIGLWSDSGAHATGKAWIPFYYGSDRVRSVLYYKHQGRIVLNSRQKVVEIQYDPTEDGYK
ncbi:MAG: hypothetical protein Q9M31_09080 [Mariprofundus sp.]|nr:hypothetical protein [Mariprofundus sp.]